MSLSQLKVLVVEDDLLFNQLYGMFFQSKNADIYSAVSVAEASKFISQLNDLDILILDQLLPDGEGLSLIPLIRKSHPEAVIVMVSGNQDPEFFLHAYNQTVDNYAVKPVNLDLLWVEISRSLSRRRLERTNAKQQAELEQWIEQEKHEQQLAQHIFLSMTSDLISSVDFLKVKIRPSAMFSGDVLFHQQGLDGSWYFLLADSMGHGLAAAVSLMPMLQAFQSMTHKALPLSTIVFELNHKLNLQLPDDRFVACVLICINPLSDRIEIWNGGMPAVLMLDEAGHAKHKAKSTHMSMGILGDEAIEVSPEVYRLSDFQQLVLCSDGVYETLLLDGTYLNEDDVAAFWRSEPELGFEKLLDALAETQPIDDLSLCTINLTKLKQLHSPVSDYASRTGSLECGYTIVGDCLKMADVTGNLVQLLKGLSVPQELCNKTYTVVTELFLNALEHGILQLDSQIKQQEDGFFKYYEMKDQALQNLDEKNFITISLCWQAQLAKLTLRINDSGEGFAPQQSKLGLSDIPHGRGLSLITQLSESVQVSGNGNQFEVVLRG